MEGLIFFFLLLQGCVFGFFSSYIAGQKGRDNGSWFVLGFFFSFIALIAIGVVPSLDSKKSKAGLRKCPSCAEDVKAEAKICRFCQAELPEVAQRTEASWLNAVTEEQKIKIQHHKITFENGKYVFKFFRKTIRFANLDEAIKHADYCEKL
jgi:hypothetical protein